MNDIRLAMNMPWVLAYEFRRITALPIIRFMFALHGIAWGRRWRIWGMPIIQKYRGSQINLGDGLYMRSWPSTNPLTPNHPIVLATRSKNAEIIVGEDVGMTGATIVSAERVIIGNRVQIGANSTIVDTDFHPLDPHERRVNFLAGGHSPVIIDDDVFIGMHSLILKGVRIGEGSVIGAGSVVTRNVPSFAIVAGNPATVIGQI
jgi:acetyltransferase-like isoleucine patch superfamily enzyme